MCGLAGTLDLARQTAEDDLRARVARMAATLVHRGPDSEGTWVDAAAGIAFGHRRLAIIDLSPTGHQPMVSADGRFVIAYNGETYNFRELRRELEARGTTFRGHSDTEVALEAIAAWGIEDGLSRLNGMFAFALWDRTERRLHLVRDRLGIKPLYYGRQGDSFLFASELRALRAHPAFAAEIDRDALALYMRHNVVPAPRSIFRGIHKLAPGTLLTLDAEGQGAPRPYWSLREVAERGREGGQRGDTKEVAEELDELLRDAVKRRMIADVPLGVFLSCGTDSSLVAALMQAQSRVPIKTFTIGHPAADFDEAKDAKRVAHHLGTDHHELYVGADDALAVVARLPAYYDEPFADSSQIPTFLVSQMARREVIVALSGDGGDEMFGGYERHLWCERIARHTGGWPGWLKRSAASGLRALSPDGWDRLAARLPAAWRRRSTGDKLHKLAGVIDAHDAAEIYRGLVSHWRDDGIVIGGHPERGPVSDRPAWPDLPDFTRQIMYLDAVTYLPDDILTKVDRASMAVSLEARVPLLDHRVVEFAWRQPLGHMISGGRGKHILREVLYRYVPRALIEREKMGFAVPLHEWLRGPLRDWSEALLDEARLAREGFFAPAPVRAVWREHLSGRRNRHHELWDVLMFQAWHEAL